MKLKQTLTLKQSLKMTVKMQESIKLLQLSNQDILKYIKAEPSFIIYLLFLSQYKKYQFPSYNRYARKPH